MRCLLVRERLVPPGRTDEYGAAWRSILMHAAAASANAWAFRSTTVDDRFMEFVEWHCDGGPPASVSAALAELDLIAPPLSGGAWKEWKPA